MLKTQATKPTEEDLRALMMEDVKRIAKSCRDFKVGRLPPHSSKAGAASGGLVPKKKKTNTVKSKVVQYAMGLEDKFTAGDVANALGLVRGTVNGYLVQMTCTGELTRGSKTKRGYWYRVNK